MNNQREMMVCVVKAVGSAPKKCASLRCDCEKHFFGKAPKFMDTVYESCGQDRYGNTVYAKTSNNLFTCLRCGARDLQSVFTYEIY
jgi:hypothetical protein